MGREGILHSTASDSAHGTRGIAPEKTGRTQVYTDPQSLLEMSRNKEQEQAHPGGSQINKEVVSVKEGLSPKRTGTEPWGLSDNSFHLRASSEHENLMDPLKTDLLFQVVFTE